MIDQNGLEHGLGEQTFIILEQASGLDLKLLSQVIRFGPASIANLPTDQESTFFFQQWSQFLEFPQPLLVRILLGVLNLLETIHTTVIRNEQYNYSGVIWNDVKPEHLYWDPLRRQPDGHRLGQQSIPGERWCYQRPPLHCPG